MNGMILLQVATGAFFVTTGYRKVFREEVRSKVIPFIQQQAKVPRPVAVAVTYCELLGGVALTTGILSRLAALGLLVLMLVAYVTTAFPEAKAKSSPGDHWTKLLSNALCNPEAQFVLILAALVLGGTY